MRKLQKQVFPCFRLYPLVKFHTRFKINIGFDMGSLVREYAALVPFEFDFNYESSVANYLRYHLYNSSKAAGKPLVVIPKQFKDFSNSDVLVMERLEGVPLLDATRLRKVIRSKVLCCVS